MKTNRYLRRHWSAARVPIVRPDATCDIEIIADSSPRIAVAQQIVWSDGVIDDLCAGFEQWLYRAAMGRHEGQLTVFHASAVVSERSTLVFSGPSGAGKSSLALAAVRRGWKYFSDEFVVTDGQHVWGWPRAIRFDARVPGAPRPAYLDGLDVDDDAESGRDDGPPYYAVPVERLQRFTSAARDVRFVRVERGEQTTLSRVSTEVGLKHLTESCFFEPATSLGALVGRDRSWCASWYDPDALLDLIEKT